LALLGGGGGGAFLTPTPPKTALLLLLGVRLRLATLVAAELVVLRFPPQSAGLPVSLAVSS
jgi:hypothetical protein